MRLSSQSVLMDNEPDSFGELNPARMDYRELSADDLDLLTPLLRSEETKRRSGGVLYTSRRWTGWWIRCAAIRPRAVAGCSHLINQPAFPRLCAA